MLSPPQSLPRNRECFVNRFRDCPSLRNTEMYLPDSEGSAGHITEKRKKKTQLSLSPYTYFTHVVTIVVLIHFRYIIQIFFLNSRIIPPPFCYCKSIYSP